MMTGTYSPDDNKLRLYAQSRLDPDLYARVKAAGFRWAPKQDLFVAPAWTPDREDLLLELCGTIDDEDTSLMDRAEAKAERAEEHAAHRQAESEATHKRVDELAYQINGQPILIGHHSEKRSRRDYQRIHDGTRKAIDLAQTAKYWERRAQGALHHAKYKERPDVRARRIKTLEAALRKSEKELREGQRFLKYWQAIKAMTDPAEAYARARGVANYDSHGFYKFPMAEYPRVEGASPYEGDMSLWSALDDRIITGAQAAELAMPSHVENIAWRQRWADHYRGRLVYERAMLAGDGGIVADRSKPEKGGACQCWASPGYGRGWSYIKRVNKVSVTVEDNHGNGGRTFTRVIPFDKLTAVMTAAQVAAEKAAGTLLETADGTGFYIG